MADRSNSLFGHFRQVSNSSSPKAVSLSHLYNRYGNTLGDGSDSGLAEQVRQLADELGQQGQVVGELASAVTGKGSSLASAGSSLLGGSVLGGLAGAAAGGFSWQSVLKDIFPLGGLVSGIAGLFSSPATPPPLTQYDAPASLNFSGVLGMDGRISQAAGDAFGQDRASSSGINLLDAAGGPRSAYSRASDGSLQPTAGAPSSQYNGVLDLSSMVRGLVSSNGPAAAATETSARAASEGSATASASDAAAVAKTGTADAAAGPAVPVFDGPWFMDHAPYIAAAVRNAMLEYHPIVDVVNEL